MSARQFRTIKRVSFDGKYVEFRFREGPLHSPRFDYGWDECTKIWRLRDAVTAARLDEYVENHGHRGLVTAWEYLGSNWELVSIPRLPRMPCYVPGACSLALTPYGLHGVCSASFTDQPYFSRFRIRRLGTPTRSAQSATLRVTPLHVNHRVLRLFRACCSGVAQRQLSGL